MPHQRNRSSTPAVHKAERAILFQLLRDDHAECWTRQELDRELSDIEPSTVSDALERLKREGIAQLSKGLVWATRCARHLDTLEVIGF